MRYLARVQLHGARSIADYEALHTVMARVGFSRIVESDRGSRYILPTGSYISSAYASAAAARDEVKKAVASTRFQGEAIIAEYSESAWFGLTSAR